ncbi:hypothetical protein CCP3SC1_670014 [Gammaproteobacteria bacterium]
MSGVPFLRSPVQWILHSPPPVETPRVLLIDLDNCPSQLTQLPQAVAHFNRVVVCYGGFEPKIQLNQLSLLAPAVVAGRLAIEPMERKGKNAADFGLTFWAGRLLAEMPPETEFVVLSQDSDLDYLLDMLRHAGRKAERLDGNTNAGFTSVISTQDSVSSDTGTGGAVLSLEAAAEDYRIVHIASRRTRPARRLTLINSIRSHFKGSGIDPEAVLQELIRRGILTVNRSGQVIYRDRVYSNSLQERSVPDATISNLATTSSAVAAIETMEEGSDASVGGLTAIASLPSIIPESTLVREEIIPGSPTLVLTVSGQETPTVSPPPLPPLVSVVDTVPAIGVTGPTDDYYSVHIASQRARPARRVALLNSIRSYFKNQPAVDPEAVMAELFRRGVVSQNRNGQLRYHDRPIPVSVPVAPSVPPKQYPQPRSTEPKVVRPSRVLVVKPDLPEISVAAEQVPSPAVTEIGIDNVPTVVLSVEVKIETDAAMDTGVGSDIERSSESHIDANSDANAERSEIIGEVVAPPTATIETVEFAQFSDAAGESTPAFNPVLGAESSIDPALKMDAIPEPHQEILESSCESVTAPVDISSSVIPLTVMETLTELAQVVQEFPKSIETVDGNSTKKPRRVRTTTPKAPSNAQTLLTDTNPQQPRPSRRTGATRSTRKPRTLTATELGSEASDVEKITAIDS